MLPVNPMPNEAPLEQGRNCISNLLTTLDTLVANCVTKQEQTHRSRQQQSDTCAAGWNALHKRVGSFADEHATL